jgi:hypothetical protein
MKSSGGRTPPPATCAVCGADIPRGAKACPECGADERTGWRETSIYDGLDLPEEAWRDPDAPPPIRRDSGLAWHWIVAAVAVLVGLVLAVFGLR